MIEPLDIVRIVNENRDIIPDSTRYDESIRNIQADLPSSVKEPIDVITIRRKKAGLELELAQRLQNGLKDMVNLNSESSRWNRALAEVEAFQLISRDEIRLLRREESELVDCLEAMTDNDAGSWVLADAYSSLMQWKLRTRVTKVEMNGAAADVFEKETLRYYNCDQDSWCHIAGPGQDALEEDSISEPAFEGRSRAIPIVPVELECPALARLFGLDGDIGLFGPQNALLISSRYVDYMESLDIVFTPVFPKQRNGGQDWRIMVTRDMRNRRKPIPASLKELDGRFLKFPGDRCPSQRFFFLRFVLAFIKARQRGDVEWVANVESQMFVPWYSSRPFIQKALLLAFIGKSIAYKFPERLFKGVMFEDKLCDEQTEDMAEELHDRMSWQRLLIQPLPEILESQHDEAAVKLPKKENQGSLAHRFRGSIRAGLSNISNMISISRPATPTNQVLPAPGRIHRDVDVESE